MTHGAGEHSSVGEKPRGPDAHEPPSDSRTCVRAASLEGDLDPKPGAAIALASASAPNPQAKTKPPRRAPDLPERLPVPKSTIESDHPSKVGTGEPLLLADVINSVGECYPLLEVAYHELTELEGKHLAAAGKFDTKLGGESISAPQGFYQTYRNAVKVSQPLFRGGEVYGGYRIGDGNFQPWFGERETNEGGEFKTGFLVPLLKDRHIDDRRANLWATSLDRQRLEPDIQARIIEITRAAAEAYWVWVAAGQAVRTQQYLVRLAEIRNKQIDARIREGDLPNISRLDNGRFIAKRQEKLIEAERKLQAASYKLSLFWRDENGIPQVPDETRVPRQLPEAEPLGEDQVEADIAYALSVRPEIVELNLQRELAGVELQYAENLTLPAVDVGLEAGQDLGAAASSKRDKSPFELEAAAFASVPLQRREAAGKIRAAEAKIQQINAKQRFVADKITAQVRDAVSAVNRAAERIERSEENLRLVRQSLELGRLSFDVGDIDLIQLNIYETDAADAELLLIQSELDYFLAITDYRAARAEEQGRGLILGVGRDVLEVNPSAADRKL